MPFLALAVPQKDITAELPKKKKKLLHLSEYVVRTSF